MSASAQVEQLERDTDACWAQLSKVQNDMDNLLCRSKDTVEELKKFVRMGYAPKTLHGLELAIAICEDRRITDKMKRKPRGRA